MEKDQATGELGAVIKKVIMKAAQYGRATHLATEEAVSEDKQLSPGEQVLVMYFMSYFDFKIKKSALPKLDPELLTFVDHLEKVADEMLEGIGVQ